MLQHQVSNIFFSKFFSGVSYFLFVRCIQLLHVIVPNPSLKTFLSSLSFQSPLLIAKGGALFQTFQGSTSKITSCRADCLPACLLKPLVWRVVSQRVVGLMQWILMNTTYRECIYKRWQHSLLLQCLAVTSDYQPLATEILKSRLKGGMIVIMFLEPIFSNSVRFANSFYCFLRLSPLRQIHFSPVQTYSYQPILWVPLLWKSFYLGQ